MKDAGYERGTKSARLHRWSDMKVTGQPGVAPTGRRSRIYLVDRHALMRKAAAEWIKCCSNLEVCGMAGSMAGAFKAVRRLHPDLVVCEILRPQDLGFIRGLHWRYPDLPILVFTSQDAAVYAMRARDAGACGYVMKEAGGDEFVQNIHAILRRQNRLRDAVAARPRCVGRRTGSHLEY